MNPANRTFWTGCHGVRLDGCPLDVGRASGTPLGEARAVVEPLAAGADRAGTVVWEIQEDVATPNGVTSVDQWLRRRRDGTFLLESSSGHTLTVDPRARHITVDGRDDAVRLQLLTTFGLPLLLADADVLVIHASACWRPEGAVVICGDSGRGKSSALIGLIDAGWQAVSEDLCAIDLRAPAPVVWPGPPWVRRAHGAAGPRRAGVRFETPDKIAWDIAPWQVDGAVPVAELIFLDTPGGDEVSDVAVDPAEAIRLLARHAVWFGDAVDRGPHLFGATVDLATQVRARRVRLPVSPSWFDRLLELLPV